MYQKNKGIVIGLGIGLIVGMLCAAGYVGWIQYRAGQRSHLRADVSAEVLFRTVDDKFIVKDEAGKERPATVADVLNLLVEERVAKFRQPAVAQKK
jgi:hypothetical protein